MQGLPERHLVPEGYRGWIVVKYAVAGKEELPLEGGVLVYRYPESGVLETSSPWNPGIKKTEYLSTGASGLRGLSTLGPDRTIWAKYELSHVVEEGGQEERTDRQSGFFVGTREEYGEAKRLAPHLPPGLPPGEELQ
jgi:hypothetical protein